MSKKNRKIQDPQQAPQNAPSRSKWSPIAWAVLAGLIVAVFAVYSNVGQYAFVTFDDPMYVVRNAEVQKGLTAESIGAAFGKPVEANWVPLTMLSHMTVVNFAGLSPSAHHRMNLLLHMVATLLLFAALRRATGRPLGERLRGAGIRDSSTACRVGRMGIGAQGRVEHVLLVCGAVRVCAVCGEAVAGPVLAVLAALCLGLLAKPMLVTFPFTLLLLDVWPLRRAVWPRILVEKIPFFAVAAASSVVTYLIQRSAGAMQHVLGGTRRGERTGVLRSVYRDRCCGRRICRFFIRTGSGSRRRWNRGGAC